MLEGPKGEKVDDGRLLLALEGKVYPNMFMFMLPTFRGMNALDVLVSDVDPDSDPKDPADGEDEKKRGGGDARKPLLKEGAIPGSGGDVTPASRRMILTVRDCSSANLG